MESSILEITQLQRKISLILIKEIFTLMVCGKGKVKEASHIVQTNALLFLKVDHTKSRNQKLFRSDLLRSRNRLVQTRSRTRLVQIRSRTRSVQIRSRTRSVQTRLRTKSVQTRSRTRSVQTRFRTRSVQTRSRTRSVQTRLRT